MAVSAYSREGRLKKHPLSGTSFAVDPARSGEREQFMSLYPEAVAQAGKGRQGMVETLARKYKGFSAPHTQRIGEIQGEMGRLTAQSEEYEGKTAEEIRKLKEKQAKFAERQETFAPMVGQVTGALSGSQPTGQALGYLTKEYFGLKERQTVKAQEAAQKSLAAQLKMVGKEYEPLAEEQKERQRVLAERASMYNMFLGA